MFSFLKLIKVYGCLASAENKELVFKLFIFMLRHFTNKLTVTELSAALKISQVKMVDTVLMMNALLKTETIEIQFYYKKQRTYDYCTMSKQENVIVQLKKVSRIVEFTGNTR